jgi:hypothetical protein
MRPICAQRARSRPALSGSRMRGGPRPRKAARGQEKPARADTFCVNALATISNPATTKPIILLVST